MKRKLIEASQDYLIVCDNQNCNYKIINESKEPFVDTVQYVNKPCPLCGENLLTESDYLLSLKLQNVVNWINKYFSWLTIFSFSNKKTSIYMHVHNGIKVTSKEDH